MNGTVKINMGFGAIEKAPAIEKTQGAITPNRLRPTWFFPIKKGSGRLTAPRIGKEQISMMSISQGLVIKKNICQAGTSNRKV